MESCSDAYVQMLTELRSPEYFQTVICTYATILVIMYTIERVTEIQLASILYSSCIRTVVIRHHVSTDEKAVADADVPVHDQDVKLAAARSDISSDIAAVVLQRLEPAETHDECVRAYATAEIETHIWIQKYVVHNTLYLL